MECNRDEAIRAKVIAEKKFEAKDIKGAKRFALKAKSLFPGLEGIQQILSTLDVYIAAETKINGETDWYGILGVDPAAVEVTVRKHYRKLALLLHPDKNKCIGAEGAFKLISESWSVLSDKARRSAFDQKRKFKKTAPQKVPPSSVPKSTSCPQSYVPKSTSCPQSNVPKSTSCPQSNVPKSTSSPQTNGFRNFTKSSCPNNKVHNKASTTTSNKSGKGNSSPIPPPSSQKEKTTFWTVCLCCRVQYEYLRVYLHHNLLCPNCCKPFFAKESDNPPSHSEVINQKKQFERQNLNNSGNHANIHHVPVSGTSGVASSSSQAATMVQQAYEQVKRKREEAQAAAKKKKTHASRKTAVDSKRRKVKEDHKGGEAKKGISELFKAYTKDNQDSTVQQVKNRTILTEKARLSIHKNLKDPSPGHAKITESAEEKGNTGKEPRKEMTMDVSNPHFYVFDNDRTEECFGENEVWAVYDDDDGMPRHYAMITSVISLNPFKVKLKWLKSRFYNEHDDIWQKVASGLLRKTCGVFGLGKLEVYTLLNSFSHKVRWTEKGEERDIHIFPEKGEVWALYKNWSPNWNELTSEEDIHTYDVVEVIKDYDENLGVSVIPLVKVAGFKTLFHYHLDPKESILIRQEDMSRFSHRVPSHLLKGQEEVPSYLKGCLELDPASTPPQLQVIIAKSEEENVAEIEKKADRVGMNNGTS